MDLKTVTIYPYGLKDVRKAGNIYKKGLDITVVMSKT